MVEEDVLGQERYEDGVSVMDGNVSCGDSNVLVGRIFGVVSVLDVFVDAFS